MLPLIHIARRRAAVKSPEDMQNITVKPYHRLLEYYTKLLTQCDKIHFNSFITEKVYHSILPTLSGKVIPITHGNIADHRENHNAAGKILRFGFIGSAAPYKGLPLLMKVLDKLSHEGQKKWQLDIWGCEGTNQDNVCYHGLFQPAQEPEILLQMDLLVFPSIWDETFGFVVEEALSCGVSVLCSDRAGAQILVDPNWIFHGANGLYQKLQQILRDPQVLRQNHQEICKGKYFITMAEHVRTISEFYSIG